MAVEPDFIGVAGLKHEDIVGGVVVAHVHAVFDGWDGGTPGGDVLPLVGFE